MPFAATQIVPCVGPQMDLESHAEQIKSDREGEISYNIPYRWYLKRNDTNELTCKAEGDSQTEEMNLWLLGGRDSQGVWNGHVHTATFKVDNNMDVLYSIWNSVQLCGSLDGRGICGRMDTQICIAESLHHSPELLKYC